jgi:WXG100 family type VII secretion target
VLAACEPNRFSKEDQMPANGVSIDTEGMTRAVNKLESTSTEASGHLRAVNGQMAALQASWTGDASLRFGQAMNDWEGDFLTVIHKLDHMIEVMTGNASSYDQAADDASAVAGNWAGGLSDL